MDRATLTNPKSRIQRPRRVLKELYRLKLKTIKAGEFRALTPEEQAWCARFVATLDQFIEVGEQVLQGHDQRADRLKVRKRAGKLF